MSWLIAFVSLYKGWCSKKYVLLRTIFHTIVKEDSLDSRWREGRVTKLMYDCVKSTAFIVFFLAVERAPAIVLVLWNIRKASWGWGKGLGSWWRLLI